MHLTLGEKRLRWWSWYFMSRHLIIFLQRGWSQGGQRHDLCEGVVASIIRGAALDRPTPPRPSRQARRMHLTWPQAFSSGLSSSYPLDLYRTLCMVLVLHIQSYHLYSTGQPSPSKGSQNAPSLTPRVLFDLFEKSRGHLESHRHPRSSLELYLFRPGVLFIGWVEHFQERQPKTTIRMDS